MSPPAASPRRNRRGRARKSPTFHVSVFNCMPEPWEPWERDWADLPADAILCVLHKLDLEELLLGGVAEVCRAAREEPELWRRIDVRFLSAAPPFTRQATRANLMRSALRLSVGQCHTFLGELIEVDQLVFLAKQAHLLKILHLRGCQYGMLHRGFGNGIKKLSLLEDLTLNNCNPEPQVLELVAQVCRCLKHFTLIQKNTIHMSIMYYVNDQKAFAIARMHGLRSLFLAGDYLSNEGLTAIVDNCSHLEYLNIRDCCKISMDANLTAKCARINMDYSPPSESFSRFFSPMSSFTGFSDGGDYDPDDYHDLSLYSYLGDKIDGADFEEYERILDVKSMRRYLS